MAKQVRPAAPRYRIMLCLIKEQVFLTEASKELRRNRKIIKS